MIITSLEDFLKSIPTARGSEWSALEPFANTADVTIKSLLTGSDLYTYIDGLAVDSGLKTTLRNLIAFQLYRDAIPFVDLIQTNNGFAVVSSTNFAPASKERVERLTLWCANSIDKTTDLLITQLISDNDALTQWKKSKRFNNLTNCLFLTGIDFAEYTKTDGSRTDFLKAKGQLLAFQKNELSSLISADYLDELITQNRSNTLTEVNSFVVEICKLILVKLLEKDIDEAKKLFNNLGYMFEKKFTDYPTYAASEEYKLKIAPKYENKLEYPTFFFGM